MAIEQRRICKQEEKQKQNFVVRQNLLNQSASVVLTTRWETSAMRSQPSRCGLHFVIGLWVKSPMPTIADKGNKHLWEHGAKPIFPFSQHLLVFWIASIFDDKSTPLMWFVGPTPQRIVGQAPIADNTRWFGPIDASGGRSGQQARIET